MIRMAHEKPVDYSVGKQVIITVGKAVQRLVTGRKDAYSMANEKMLAAYRQEKVPDSELNFFAVNPQHKGQGVGSFLLATAVKDLHDQEIYLYTDSFCSYQFYDHRGFEQFAASPLSIEIGSRKVNMTAFLYRRHFETLK